jgi:hypothetical protein
MARRYWPTYAPNLTRLERFWKFVKKPGRSPQEAPDHESCQPAIRTWSEHASRTHNKALERLLPWRFHTFQTVPVMGGQHPMSKGSKQKVCSEAA